MFGRQSRSHETNLLRCARSAGARARWLGLCAGALLIAGAGPAVASASAAPTSTVDLGQASSYAVLSGASVGNTASAMGAAHTTLRGDLGVNANAQPTGFPPGVVTGTTRVGSTANSAYNDLVTAYHGVAGRTGGTAIAGDLIGQTLTPGLYSSAGAVSNTGTLTLNGGGDPNAVFVFQVGGALNMAAGAHVTLTNGATAAHVFWQVNGAAAIGANATFAGTIMALNAVAVGAGTEVNGRALSLSGAISLDSNEFYSAPPVVTIAGGNAATTNDATPTISGTTDVSPEVVTVTIGSGSGTQTLTATPSSGAWSVTSALLANATYPVTASATDGAGNTTRATQQLTIDTVPPSITLDGGPSVTTNDPTPTISGTSDVAPGTVIDVAVGSHALTALVQSGGTWNVTPQTLTDGTRTVTATVSDPAGNQSTATQTLTIDTTAPAVTISGGTSALTNNATPTISGTADEAPGTIVTVTLADQTLTGPVQSGGAWSVTTAALADGPHRVVMSVSDEAGNGSTLTQTLTVDTVAPVVTIAGGPTATNNSPDPTIAGTSDAAPGTTVTVSIAGQTMTTLLQANGTWNATPSAVGNGVWAVVASAPDPAGNVGSARQTLTIARLSVAAPGGSDPAGSTGASGPSGTAGSTGTTGGGQTGGSATGGGTTGGGTTGGGATGGSGTPVPSPRPTVRLSAARYRTALGQPVKVPFRLTGPAKLTLTLLRGKKVVARVSTTLRRSARGSLSWNGRIKRKPASKGSYTIMLTAVSATGGTAHVTATLRIT